VDAEKVRPVASAAGSGPSGGETILLVEDNRDLAEAYAALFTCLGYRILSAASAEEALEVTASEAGRVALVITDLTLPGMSGTDLGQALRARGEAVPVIVLSGYPPAGAASDAIAAWLQKPLEVEELLAAVRSALEQRGQYAPPSLR
jgi:two-component system cell cycle sensor histidine kinase/response regulator CckA